MKVMHQFEWQNVFLMVVSHHFCNCCVYNLSLKDYFFEDLRNKHDRIKKLCYKKT